MRFTRPTVAALTAVLVAGVIVAAALGSSSQRSASPARPTGSMHSLHAMGAMHPAASSKPAPTAADLRVMLDRLFGQHAVLAMNATNAGVKGAKSLPATAKALDANSVAISKAIGSVYGAKAARTFLNGRFMWRDHIKFFVAYTGALAKKDTAGQNKAVANLKRYTVAFGDGNYAKAAAAYDSAYNHMFMTGDLIAGAIAKQKNIK
jgi:hypothetical protein